MLHPTFLYKDLLKPNAEPCINLEPQTDTLTSCKEISPLLSLSY
jgi:hypothetical protein